MANKTQTKVNSTAQNTTADNNVGENVVNEVTLSSVAQKNLQLKTRIAEAQKSESYYPIALFDDKGRPVGLVDSEGVSTIELYLAAINKFLSNIIENEGDANFVTYLKFFKRHINTTSDVYKLAKMTDSLSRSQTSETKLKRQQKRSQFIVEHPQVMDEMKALSNLVILIGLGEFSVNAIIESGMLTQDDLDKIELAKPTKKVNVQVFSAVEIANMVGDMF